MEWLENIVDKSLDKMAQEEVFMKRPDPNMPKEMIDKSIPKNDDWTGWKPVKSNIRDEELDSLELKIGRELPLSFRSFLKYKCFYDLFLQDRTIGLISNLPGRTIEGIEDVVLNGWDPYYLIELGYIYFANFEDYGLLCFDANCLEDGNEYPIVFFDHEDLTIAHPYANYFRDLLESDTERGNRFIEKLNKFYAQ
jgi:hypothetical protein